VNSRAIVEGVVTMTGTFRSRVALAMVVSLTSVVGFAQSPGESVYKANCQSCHGAAGTPSPAMAKMMNVKPLSDPDIQKLSVDQMIASVKDGKGKMKPFKEKLTDAQIKDSVNFYRGLK
jgi:predicted CXXCH cytochrome family protein